MRIRSLAIVFALPLAGCAMGPDFHRPAAPATNQYTTEGESTAAQHFVSGTLPGRWWESFHCQALDALVDEALAHSPTALQARARLRQAQQDLTAQTGSTLYPSVDAQLGATRERVDPAAFGLTSIPQPPAFNLYNAQVSVSYAIDLLGASRRTIEGARAQTEYQSYETAATELTLAANVVAAAIRQADLEAQVGYTEQMIAAQERQLAISEERYRQGGISQQDLATQTSQLEQLRAALPPLKAQRRTIDHQLAVYTGKPPAEASIPRIKLSDLGLPADLPLALPAELVQRRPDVRASEALWHAASANVGVATANLFPHLSISASIGSERSQASQLVDGTNVWSVGASLLQPIFHGGELRAKRSSAVAAYEAAAQAYQETVLESLQQVADSLQVLEADAQALGARSRAAEQSAAGYAIAQQRFGEGGISEYALLDAHRQELQTSLDRTHAEAQKLADTAALMHALAGPI